LENFLHESVQYVMHPTRLVLKDREMLCLEGTKKHVCLNI
jgi:hypothetical protein